MIYLEILNAVLLLLEAILLLLGANSFFDRRKSTPLLWLSLLPLTVALYLIAVPFSSMFLIKHLGLTLVITIWIQLTHSAKWVPSIFVAILFQAYLYAGDLCFMYFASAVIKQDLSVIMQDPYAFYAVAYMTKCLCLFALVLICKWIKRRYRHTVSSWRNWIKSGLIPLFVLLIGRVLFEILVESPDRSREIFICAGLLVVLDFLSVVLLDALEEQEANRQKQEILQRSLQQEQQNLELWAEAYRNQRKQTHDFNNHLSVLRGMVEKALPAQEITDYMDRMSRQEAVGGLQISTHRHVSDILFNHKCAIANKHQIRVDLQLDDLSDFPMPDDAMTVVLSNLIDNAITACKAILEIDNRNIIIKMKRSADFWFLYIENTTAEPVKIINGRVIAKREVASLHGYGLENVQTLLDRYNATYAFDYLSAKSAFVVSIQFPTEIT